MYEVNASNILASFRKKVIPDVGYPKKYTEWDIKSQELMLTGKKPFNYKVKRILNTVKNYRLVNYDINGNNLDIMFYKDCSPESFPEQKQHIIEEFSKIKQSSSGINVKIKMLKMVDVYVFLISVTN